MKLHFSGPAGAPFVGAEIDEQDVTSSGLEALAALQRGTKLRMSTIMSRLRRATMRPEADADFLTDAELDALPEDVRDRVFQVQDRLRAHLEQLDEGEELDDPSEVFSAQVAVFLTLWGGGYRVPWATARDMPFGAFERIADEGNEDETAPDESSATDVPADPQLPATDSLPAVADAETAEATPAPSSLQ